MARTIKRTVKLEYYRVVCRNIEEMDISSSPDYLFDLTSWINIFDGELKVIKNRVRPYYEEKMRLDNFSCPKTSIWILDFMRLKDRNIPKRAFESKETEDMTLDNDEYIGENAICIYDDKTHVLAIQRNRDSLSVTGIEKYINETWKHRDGNKIYLRPIMSNETIHTLFKKNNPNYRKIRFKIADIANDIEYDSKPLNSIIKQLQGYDGSFIDITISMGHRKSSLNKAAVDKTLSELVEGNSVNKAEVFYKEGDAPVEYMDLLNGKLNDYVIIEQEIKKSVPSDYLAKKLLEQYNKAKSRIEVILKIK